MDEFYLIYPSNTINFRQLIRNFYRTIGEIPTMIRGSKDNSLNTSTMQHNLTKFLNPEITNLRIYPSLIGKQPLRANQIPNRENTLCSNNLRLSTKTSIRTCLPTLPDSRLFCSRSTTIRATLPRICGLCTVI